MRWPAGNKKQNVICSSCGCRKNTAGSVYCKHCGSQLKKASHPPEVPAKPLAAPGRGPKGGGKGGNRGPPAGVGKGADGQGQALPPGPLPQLAAEKAKELATMAKQAGDAEGARRYELLALHAPAAPAPPSLREKWLLAEKKQRDLETKLESQYNKLERWRTSQAELVGQIAEMASQLQEADKDVSEALEAIQCQSKRAPTHTGQAQPAAISIRQLVDGKVDLTQVFSVDDFMGTSEVASNYHLEESDLEELRTRKDQAAKQIQEALSSMFRGAVDVAKQAMEDHTKHLTRLEGKKRKVDAESTAPRGAAAAPAPEGPLGAPGDGESAEANGTAGLAAPQPNIRERLGGDAAVAKLMADRESPL